MMISIIGPTLVLAVLIAYEIAKNTSKEKKSSDAFWDKEREANTSRKKDISKLPYIKVPLESLPFGLLPAFEELVTNENAIRELSGEKILSLRGKTNTEVKLEYGIPNFEFLCTCDENYLKLIRCLSKEAELLLSMNFEREAEEVLNYSLSIGSDIPKDYIALANLYKTRFDRASMNNLLERADALESLTKKHLIESLEEISNSF